MMAITYGLTREMADKVVNAVRADPQCQKLLPAVSAYKFFAPLGHAGTARNFSTAFLQGIADHERTFLNKIGRPAAGKRITEYWREKGDAEACTGIAVATARVLNRLARKPGFEFLLSAGPQDRTPSHPMKDYHTATSVMVQPGKSYIFDWHATLAINCPLIFPSPTAFQAGRPSVKYVNFWGWS